MSSNFILTTGVLRCLSSNSKKYMICSMLIEMARYLTAISIRLWEVRYILVKLFISDSKMKKELNPSKNVFSINAGWKHKERENTALRTKLFQMKKLKCIIKNCMIDPEKKYGPSLLRI